MRIIYNDQVPTDLTDAQKKSSICEWFVREPLKYAECFIRAELNHAPHKMEITIEKPVEFKGELIDFADILIEYESPQKLHAKDEWNNKILALKKAINLNDYLEQSVLSDYPQKKASYHKKQTRSLLLVEYNAPYLLENELKLIAETRKRFQKDYDQAFKKAIAYIEEDCKYSKFNKEKLLISVVPSVELLKTDINASIRRIKTLDFYLGDITQQVLVYWGIEDSDVREYLQHEGIQLKGLYETLYYFDEDLEFEKDVPF